MPRIDFGAVDTVRDFAPLPEGTYRCRVADVEESSTHSGDDMWRLALEVTEGEHRGRWVFDNLVFSERALRRVKLICSRLGLDVAGEVDLTPEMLHGRECVVRVTVEEYEDASGQKKTRNSVPFAGYEAVQPGSGSGADNEGEPF